jgi:PAS domain S-box-containing protein
MASDGYTNGGKAQEWGDEDLEPLLETNGAGTASDGLIAGLVRRLTELRLANRELREALAGLDRRYGAAADCFEFSPAPCCGLDSQGNVVDINVAGTALFGCSRAAIVGRPLETFIVPEDRGVVREHLRLCNLRRVRAGTDAHVVGEDGTERLVRIVSAPFPCASAGGLAIVALLLDFASGRRISSIPPPPSHP